MKEIWKDYIYNYQISNFGRIRNKVTNKILKQNITGKGYLGCVVSLGSKNKKQSIKIHRAVAECFIPNPNNYQQVNHIDGNKKNNLYSNLEWCDNRYNTLHSYKLGLKKPVKGERFSHSKLSINDINFIRKNYIPRDINYGARALARKYNVHHKTIEEIIHNKKWVVSGEVNTSACHAEDEGSITPTTRH